MTPAPPPSLRRSAPAKINWTLEILGRRPDGFHEIDTVMQTISLHDELEFTPLPEPRCEMVCALEGFPTGEQNLIWRAWDVLRREVGGNVGGVRIAVEKRIPSGAGLGGGSSDAAATLAGLNELFALGIPPGELDSLGARLGSDVPFFLSGGAARARGRGERIEPIVSALPPVPLVVVFPDFVSPTPWAYSQLSAADFLPEPIAAKRAVEALRRGDADGLEAALFNTFDRTLPRAERRYDEIKSAMTGAGLRAPMLSGSGAACFALAGSAETASAAAARLGESYPQSFAVATIVNNP